MKLFNRFYQFDLEQERIKMARRLSFFVTGENLLPEIPYKPNEGDSYFWTLDGGNDWKVKFFEEDPTRFDIIYRYNHLYPEKEKVLGEWLKIKLGFNDRVSAERRTDGIYTATFNKEIWN